MRKSRIPQNRAGRQCINYQCEPLEDRRLLSAASLIKDINTNTLGSNIYPMGRLGTTTYLATDDGVHGYEIYRSDGTAGGTSLVTDFDPGSYPGVIPSATGHSGVVMNNLLYYIGFNFGTAAGPLGESLARTDGTAAGTQAVKIIANINGSVSNLTVAGSKIFFTMNATGPLWVSDGTSNGTQLMSSVVPSIASLQVQSMLSLNNKLYILATNSMEQFKYDLIVTDGTAAGTTVLKSAFTGRTLFYAGSTVLFDVDDGNGGIWSTDGTIAGTQLMLSNVGIDTSVSSSTTAYFIGRNPTNETLYSTNGTAAGTTPIKTGLGSPRDGMGILPNGVALYIAQQGTTYTLYRSDGTSGGTSALLALDTPNSATLQVTDVGNVGIFAGSDSTHGQVLWKSDGTIAGTTVLPINNYAAANPVHFISDGTTALFGAADGVHGNELWKTNGTAAGTSLVLDINTDSDSSSPSAFTPVNGKVWFSATSNTGIQPYVTDGTPGGTTPVSIGSASVASITNFLGLGANVFFTSSPTDNGGPSLWVSNGSTASVIQSSSTTFFAVGSSVAFNNAVYFVGESTSFVNSLWKSNGTTAGTTVVSSGITADILTPLAVVGSTLFMGGTVGSAENVYAVSTSNVVTPLTTFTTQHAPLQHATVANGKLYFVYNDGTNVQLWQSNGTAAGTSMVKQLTTGNPSFVTINVTTSNNTIYIATTDPANTQNTELFKSDGTAAGTVLIKNLAKTTITPSDSFLGVNGNLFFTADFITNGAINYPFFSDGTSANTIILMSPQAYGSPYASSMAAAGGEVYFRAFSSGYGFRLWKTDGTTEGTTLAQDIDPGHNLSQPNNLAQIGGILYFAADDGIHGTEPMRAFDEDTVNTSAAASTVTLTQDGDHVNIDWTNGAASGKVPINAPTGLTVKSNGSPATIVLSGTNPLPNFLHLNGTFTLNGLPGTNALANTNLEIGRSAVYFTYAGPTADPLNTLRGYLKNGYANGAWNGTGTSTTGVITSTAAANDSAHGTGIGYADSADGLVPLPANTIELKYTLYGDTGLTGSVGFTDFMRMTQHYTLAAGATWGAGDFNYDGAVNSTDFNLLQPNYGTTLPAPAPNPVVESPMLGRPPRTAQLPPPTDLGLASVNSTVQTSGGVDAVALPKSKKLLVKAHASRKRH